MFPDRKPNGIIGPSKDRIRDAKKVVDADEDLKARVEVIRKRGSH